MKTADHDDDDIKRTLLLPPYSCPVQFPSPSSLTIIIFIIIFYIFLGEKLLFGVMQRRKCYAQLDSVLCRT